MPGAAAIPSERRGALLLAALAVLLAGAAAYRGALAHFFSQDDFAGLARAHGLLPRLSGPWRWLSGQAYFDVMRRLAGLEPLAYHAVSLGAHLAWAAAALAWMRAYLSPPIAMLAAVFLVVHPAVYTAVYSVSGIGEILAAGFALAALIAARRTDRRAWAALPLFAASLLCKETTVLLPAVALAERALRPPPDPEARRRGRAVLAALALLAAAYLAAFLALDVFAMRGALPASAPYRLAIEAVPANLLTYAGWTVHIVAPWVRSFADAVDPAAMAPGGALLVALAAACLWPAARRRGAGLGALLYLAFLLPVLPLGNHTYHYYLYAPLAGAALALGAVVDAARRAPPPGARAGGGAGRPARGRPARRGGVVAWAAAAAAAALLCWNGAVLVRKIEHHPFLLPELRADPTVDRARIAGHVIADLRAAGVLPGARLVFWSPIAPELARAAGGDPSRETYYERNVREAIADGLAVRLFFPGAAVDFVRAHRPLAPGERWAIYRPDGRVRVVDEDGLRDLLATLPRGPRP